MEGVLRIFIALRNPSPSAELEPAKVGYNGKHANHYTTDDDSVWVTYEDQLRKWLLPR
jgi:hypothetical protein